MALLTVKGHFRKILVHFTDYQNFIAVEMIEKR